MLKTALRTAAAAAVTATLLFGQSAGAVELKASNWLPPKFPNSVGMKALIDQVKKETDGEVTFRFFPGGALLGAKATLDGIKDGVADMGHIVMTYFPATFPYGQLVSDLAMDGDNPYAASFAWTELEMLHCPGCVAEQKATNLLFLGTYSTPNYVLISKKPIKMPADLKGQKMRSGGGLWDRWAEYVGGVPVAIPASEMYEGLERGQLDIAIYALGGLKTHGLADVAKSVTVLPIGAFRASSVFAFNRDTWNDLTVDQRKAMLKAAATGIAVTDVEYQKGDDQGVVVAKEKGIDILEPGPELKDLRKTFIAKDLSRTVDYAKSEYGIDNAQAIIDKFDELYAKYDKLLAPTNADPEKMAEILYQEAFSKVDPEHYGVD